jgi:hypothetical protein
MNFNYLIEDKRNKVICKKKNLNECQWSPTGRVWATSGNNVCVSMYCKKCECKEDIFLTLKEFKIQEKILSQEVGNV